MNIKTSVKAGITKLLDKTSPLFAPNHNQSRVRDRVAGLAVKSRVKEGATAANHNQTQVRVSASRRIKALCAGFTIAAALFGHAVYAQSTVHMDPLGCTTSAGTSAFNAISWSLTVDPTQRVPPVITLTKPVDGCSAALYRSFNGKGSKFKAASITVRDSDSKVTQKGGLLESIGFANVTIIAYSLNGGGSTPTESITFAFTDLTIQW